MLELSNVRITNGKDKDAFHVLVRHLSVNDGGVAVISGPSGSGKSTLLQAAGLITRPDPDEQGVKSSIIIGRKPDGSARVIDSEADDSTLSVIRAGSVGFMLQVGGLVPFLTVRENIAFPLKLKGCGIRDCWGDDFDSLDDWIDKYFKVLNLETSLLSEMPGILSVGQAQRVSFLRALVHHPDVLLADEPTASLDPETARSLFGTILDMVRTTGISALVVTHDPELIGSGGMLVKHVTAHEIAERSGRHQGKEEDPHRRCDAPNGKGRSAPQGSQHT